MTRLFEPTNTIPTNMLRVGVATPLCIYGRDEHSLILRAQAVETGEVGFTKRLARPLNIDGYGRAFLLPQSFAQIMQ